MTVFERIDAWLKENHMSRRKLATLAGIPPSSFQSAMERQGKLSDKMLQAIAPIMGTTVDDLITTSDLKTPDGGHIRILEHPDSDFAALQVENLTMAEMLSFCRISRSGGVSDSLLRELLKSAIQHHLEYIDPQGLEEIAEKIVSLQGSESEE